MRLNDFVHANVLFLKLVLLKLNTEYPEIHQLLSK